MTLIVVNGWKIKALREKLGMSRKECCKQAGISENTLRKLETEEDCCAMIGTLTAIARVLGVDRKLLGSPVKRVIGGLGNKSQLIGVKVLGSVTLATTLAPLLLGCAA